MREKTDETMVYDAFSGPHPVVGWLLDIAEKGADTAGPRPVGPSRICKDRGEMEREARQWGHLGVGVQ